MQALWQDVRYALRRMRAAPVFTLTAIGTLAIAIGANTAVFSVVDAALLRGLPYPNADRVVAAFAVAPFGHFVASPPDFTDWRAQTHSFAEMAAFDAYPRTMTGLGEPRSVPAARVTSGFFSVLGVAPALGRPFTPEESKVGNTTFVIISHALWRQKFGERRDVIGRPLELDGRRFTIVGVMPGGFRYPARTDLWTPLAFSSEELATQRGAHYLEVLALLKPGVSVAAADADLASVAGRLAQLYPATNKNYSAGIQPLREYLVGSTPRRALLILLAAVTLVAIIACVNVANLVLARGTARRRELAVRVALGAAPRDLLYMALTESVMLALFGGALGLVVAIALSGALDALRPEALRQVGELRMSGAAGLFTFALSLVVGIAFGLLPGLRASRGAGVHAALQGGGRSDMGDRTLGRVRSMLVSAELALALILLSGAGLLIKSFTRLHQVDAGFDARNVAVFSVSLPDARYHESPRVATAFQQIVERMRAIPGVEVAGAMSMLPMDGDRYSISTNSLDGRSIPSADQPSTQIRIVTPEAFAALQVHLKAGRAFQSSDRAGAPPVVILNESAARKLWNGVDPLGHTLAISTRFTEDTSRAGGTVVGVVADFHDASLGTAPNPIVFFPHAQAPWSDMSVVLRLAGQTPPSGVLRAAERELHAFDRLLPMNDARTMSSVVSDSMAQPRFATVLMGTFAALAVVLAIIGVFGVMAYIVGQRTREIGVRVALGASHRRVVGETLSRAVGPLVIGSALGVVATLALARFMARLLYDVKPNDPIVLGAVTMGLVLVALVAAYVPARRASAVDPLIALRAD
jgi:predicted permease